MKSNAPAAGFGSAGQSHDHEARLLVQLLRTSRLSLLYAEARSDKTALLTLALMPLLSRRVSDKLAPAGARPSGVVVPFPDRRSRLSHRALKCRREIVVYFDHWTGTPVAALREALHLGTATGPAEQLAPSMRLSEVLGDLSRRLDAHLIVLLDRFEDFLQASPSTGHAEFANELVEAVNLTGLPASFLIALNEEARPRLAGLQSRIPGFDDFSLKLAPPREFKAPVAPRIVTSATKAADPRASAAPPVLLETLEIPPFPSRPVATPTPGPTVRLPSRQKMRFPLPRVEVKTEDVYTMIEESLSRIAARAAIDVRLPDTADGSAQGSSAASLPQTSSASGAPTHGKDLRKAIEKMERRFGVPPGSTHDS